MLILDGKEVSRKLRAKLLPRVEAFQKKMKRPPHLSVVIVGGDKASHVYVENKKKACDQVGITSTIHAWPEMNQDEMDDLLKSLNRDDSVDAVLVQFPLPKPLTTEQVLNALALDKDADGLTFASLGYFFAGHPVASPCTPRGIMSILDYYDLSVAGLNAVVVGRSHIVGRPMAQMLTDADATVTLCHSKTKNLREFTCKADLVVVAAGQARFLGAEDFKKDAIVIDVGMHGSGKGGKLCGDVRFEELDGHVKAATPVPGGVGPMTITTLLQNTCLLAERRAGMTAVES